MREGRLLLKVVLTAWVVLAGSAAYAEKSPPNQDASDVRNANSDRPNIIFILADDLGWGDLRCYGNRRIKTPNLDRLARQGIRFAQFYVCSGVCSPSRAAFMTGRFPARLGIHGHFARHELNAKRGMPNFLDPSVPTVARFLHEAGYATAHFGKWHLGSGQGAPPPAAYGFDVTYTINSNGPGWDEKQPYFRARSSDLIVDETIRFIESNRNRPFFVQAWFLLPHATLNPTEEQMAPYRHFGPKGVPHRGASEIYYGSVTAIDTAVGRLMKKLDELGLADNTLVIFSSDNGPEDIHISNASHSAIGSPGPFRGRKRSLYEGGIRMPLIARWPGHTPAGAVNKASVMAGVDFLPTLCSLARVRLPDNLPLDGENMAPALLGRDHQRRKPLMWEWRFGVAGHVINKCPILAIREGRWKLLMNPDRSRIELYDIPADPSELNNLADRRPDVVERMAQMVLAWQRTLPPGPMDSDAGSNAYPWAW